MALLGVGLNAVVPEDAFEIGINLTALGTLTAWGVIVLGQIRLRRPLHRGPLVRRPSFRLPGAPFTSYLTLGFLGTASPSPSCSNTRPARSPSARR